MKLVKSIEGFHNGTLSREELMLELNGELEEELANPTVLAEAITRANQWQDFPEDITDLLKTRLAEASGTSQDIARYPYRGDEPYAFICYCETDTKPAFRQIGKIEKLRFNCYFDTGDQSGSIISDDFAQRLMNAKAFIFLISPDSVASQRCRRELTLALDSDIPVIAAYLQETDLPPGLRLSLSDQLSIALYRLTSTDAERQLKNAFEQIGLKPNPEPEELENDGTVVLDQPTKILKPGSQLGRFRLEERLGSGGMSLVYKAMDTRVYGEYVAIKVLNPDFAQHPDARIALIRETAKTAKFTHPNIVNVIDCDDDGPHLFMWMDYLDGESLSERLRNNSSGGLPLEEAHLILEGIIDGLNYAHNKNMVHADFKPGNVMLVGDKITDKDQVKIIDFGIAQAVRSTETTSSDADQTVYDIKQLGAYTEAYASIELMQNQDAEPSDDVYALGCVAYEIFTGEHPFNKKSLAYAQNHGLSVPQNPNLTAAQHAAISHALTYDRASRTATALEFLKEFNGTPSIREVERQPIPEPRLLPKPKPKPKIKIDPKPIVFGVAGILTLGIAVWLFQNIETLILGAPTQVGAEFSDCWDCPEMIVVPAGTFEQGGTALRSEQPSRTVKLLRDFAVSTHEVTVDEFAKFASATNFSAPACDIWRENSWQRSSNHSWQAPGFDQSDDHPVTCVSWLDAQAYTTWLSTLSDQPYRLLSASEWEYLAKDNPNSKNLCSAANIADQTAQATFTHWTVGECDDSTLFTAPVGKYAVNSFGVADMLGNVFEWTADCWQTNYQFALTDGTPQTGPICEYREARGGSWFTQPDYVYPEFRNRLPENTRSSTVGFRIARDLTPNS